MGLKWDYKCVFMRTINPINGTGEGYPIQGAFLMTHRSSYQIVYIEQPRIPHTDIQDVVMKLA